MSEVDKKPGIGLKNERGIFGCLIAGDVLFLLKENIIVNINSNNKKHSGKSRKLHKTMSRLLIYFIDNRETHIIKIDDLLFYVWDSHELQSSRHRLLKTIHTLWLHLVYIGVPEKFISHIDNDCFVVKWGFVKVIYF
ncbi:hypothetical protein I5N59_24165 [Serratia marcescens]|uniref:hypothetical protein n=1 Tax=Serratia marcescens TaxID=615 RepID=UPI0018D8BA0A|nr:hypothetical protein [Serratia marcescens]